MMVPRAHGSSSKVTLRPATSTPPCHFHSVRAGGWYDPQQGPSSRYVMSPAGSPPAVLDSFMEEAAPGSRWVCITGEVGWSQAAPVDGHHCCYLEAAHGTRIRRSHPRCDALQACWGAGGAGHLVRRWGPGVGRVRGAAGAGGGGGQHLVRWPAPGQAPAVVGTVLVTVLGWTCSCPFCFRREQTPAWQLTLCPPPPPEPALAPLVSIAWRCRPTTPSHCAA